MGQIENLPLWKAVPRNELHARDIQVPNNENDILSLQGLELFSHPLLECTALLHGDFHLLIKDLFLSIPTEKLVDVLSNESKAALQLSSIDGSSGFKTFLKLIHAYMIRLRYNISPYP